MTKTSNTTYAKFSHHKQQTHMDCLKILATDAALVIRVYWKSLEKELFNFSCANVQLAYIGNGLNK